MGPPQAGDTAEMRRAATYMAYQNGFIQRVERLPGNVGYLRIDAFGPEGFAEEPIRAAMGVVAHTDALIIDLRENNGGSPATVALLASWLLGEQPVHLNTTVTRDTAARKEYWTRPQVAGATRYGTSKPVYVLTSHGTFSGGEEFAYDMQAIRRATLVGETTGGGAHPTSPLRATAHFAARVPFARAVNPVTHTNWEGTGVRPDVAAPAADALAAAHRLALKALLPAADELRRDEIAQALATLGETAPAAVAAGK
jgi:C-terminal processing protease CtpA/Prc